MAGRGRGRGALRANLTGPATTGNLRRPGDTPSDPPVASQEKQPPNQKTDEEQFDVLMKKIKTLSLAPKSTDLVEVQKLSKDCGTDGKKIETIAQTIYDRCLEDSEFSVTAADLCERLTGIEADTTKFRSCILKLIQRDYKDKDSIYKESKSKFICFSSILCQLFGHLKINNEPMKPLVGPVYDCLEILLDGGGDEMECFNMQIQTIGRNLEKANSTRMKSMIQTVRTKVISSSSSARQRCLLLEVLEIRGRGWTDHDAEVASFYTDLLMDLQATEVLN